MRSLSLVLVLALFACGKAMTPPPDAGTFDAGPTCLDDDAGTGPSGSSDGGDFSCQGQARELSAARHLTVSGFVTAAGLLRKPLAGAKVELLSASGEVLFQTVSADDDAGTWAVSTELGCVPLDAALRASKPDAGYFDAWYYPPAPFRQSRGNLELSVFSAPTRDLVAFLTALTIDAGTAGLALSVQDCAGTGVPGATITSSPPGAVRYVGANGVPTATDMATTSSGQLLIFNLPPGPVDVTATVNGHALPTRRLQARGDAITTTTLTP